MKIEIETSRIILRELRVGDLEGLMQINDLDIIKWLESIDYPYTEKDARGWIDFCVRESKKGRYNRQVYMAGIELKKNRKFIGEIGLNPVNLSLNTGELVYWLAKKYHGRGFALEALKGFITFSFHNLELNELKAFLKTGNYRSENLLEKSGFHLLRVNREGVKEYTFSIEDYLKQKSA